MRKPPVEERSLPPPSLADVIEVENPEDLGAPALDDGAPELDDEGEDIWPGDVPDEFKEHR